METLLHEIKSKINIINACKETKNILADLEYIGDRVLIKLALLQNKSMI